MLVHGGWDRRRALRWNLISGALFPIGALSAWAATWRWNPAPLALFGAGNFLYIAASDLVPEIKVHPDLSAAAVHYACFTGSLLALYRRIADASPNDPSVQLELAQAAEGANDAATAIQAYEKFLRLAPEDPTAPEVRRILKDLRQRTGATG